MRLIIFGITLFCSLTAAAQSRTFIRYTIGNSFDRSEKRITEPGFRISKGSNVLYGGMIEQEFGRHWSAETGIASKFYAFDGYFPGSDTSDILAAADYLQIPVRVKFRYFLFNEHFSVTPTAGISFVFLNKGGFNNIVTGTNNGLDLTIIQAYRKQFYLLEAGLAFEYELGTRWRLGIEAARYFSTSSGPLAEYIITNKPIYHKLSSSFYSVQAGVGFALFK